MAETQGDEMEVTREFGVDLMHCGKCESRITNALNGLGGDVSWVQVSLGDKTVQAHGKASNEQLIKAMEGAGFEARLIGIGNSSVVPSHVGPAGENGACVAEFKGEPYGHGSVHGVVRLVQVSPDSAQLEAIVGGLTPGEPHTIAVHKSGDLSRGPAAVGGVFQGDVAVQAGGRKAGELCTASADDKGVLRCKGPADLLKVWEIIGRSCVVHRGSAVVDGRALAAAVIARSAGVGANHKMVCACDGTILWDADGIVTGKPEKQ